jgi:hypothetical protein
VPGIGGRLDQQRIGRPEVLPCPGRPALQSQFAWVQDHALVRIQATDHEVVFVDVDGDVGLLGVGVGAVVWSFSDRPYSYQAQTVGRGFVGQIFTNRYRFRRTGGAPDASYDGEPKNKTGSRVVIPSAAAAGPNAPTPAAFPSHITC